MAGEVGDKSADVRSQRGRGEHVTRNQALLPPQGVSGGKRSKFIS